MRGKVIKYEQNNIDTDLIIPARFLVSSDPDHLAGHCFEDLDAKFLEKKQELDATIIIAGTNFGCGSSREQAPLAMKTAGIKCVIAPSFARIFLRNSINIGLPLIEFSKINYFNTGDELEIDFKNGVIINMSSGKHHEIKKMPPFIQEIITAEGLVMYARNIILKNK